MSPPGCHQLCALALDEFPDIVADVQIIEVNELRILLVDDSFIDVWYSLSSRGAIAITGNAAPSMARSIAMITLSTFAGAMCLRSRGTFTMATSSPSSRAA